jgi:hypothetical protein
MPGDYCPSKSEFPWHDWIAGVQVGGINHPSGKTAYSNFTNLNTNLPKGSTIPIALTAGFSWATFQENWRLWIDFNKNGTFEATEKVLEGVQNAPAQGTPSAIFNGTLAIPGNVATGTTRMRISMKRGAFADPCELLPFGEVEDYSVNIIGEAPTTNYCNSSSDFPWHDWIAGVKIGSIDNPSGKSAYSDFTNQITDLSRGATTPITLSTGFSWETFNENWNIWIDFNKNNVFEAPGELVYTGILNQPAQGTTVATLNGGINIPANAPPGVTRMRVSMKRGAASTPCETLPFGEVEDYRVNILSNLKPPQENLSPALLAKVASNRGHDFAVYPNPASQAAVLDLKSNTGKAGELLIFNAQGVLLRSLKISADAAQYLPLDLSTLNAGYYFLQLRMEGDGPMVLGLMVME